MSVSTVHLCRLLNNAIALIQARVWPMHSFKLVCCRSTCPCTRSDSLSVFLLTSALLQNWFVVLPYQNVLIHDWLVLPARWTTCCRTRTTVSCSARTATALTSRAAACTSRPCTKRQVRNNFLAQTSSLAPAQPPQQVPPLSTLLMFVGLRCCVNNKCQ